MKIALQFVYVLLLSTVVSSIGAFIGGMFIATPAQIAGHFSIAHLGVVGIGSFLPVSMPTYWIAKPLYRILLVTSGAFVAAFGGILGWLIYRYIYFSFG